MKKTTYIFLAALLLVCSGLSAQDKSSDKSVVDSIKTEKLYLPINTVIDRNLTTGTSRSFTGEDLEKYPTGNLMNSFTGVIPGLFVTESSGAHPRYHTESVSLKVRGYTSITYIIDDVAIEEPSEIQLNPEEIESITLLSDIVDKVKFGPQVARGALYIRTLRGTPEGRQIKVGFEKGLDVVDRMPEWCGGVDYALLNNQARMNANEFLGTETYPVRFDDMAIEGFRQNNNMDPMYPNVDYKALMLKNTRDFNKAYVLVRGGNDDVMYSANLGYFNQGDLYTVGNPSNFNRFNAKMNIDIVINPKLKANFSFLGTYSMRNSPYASYSDTGNTYEFPTVWSRIHNTPPVEYPLSLGVDEETGKTTYPLSTSYSAHPYASVLESGGYKESLRVGVTKVSLDYDMSALLKGLKSESQISYNTSHNVKVGQGADYIGYLYNKEDGTTEITSHQGASASSAGTNNKGYLQGLQFHEKLYHDFLKGNHELHTSLTYYWSKLAYSIEGGYHKQQNGIFAMSYNFKKKYLFDVALNYAGTSARKQGHRYQLFPAVGLGWVATDEDFLKDSSWLSYLKLRAQAGELGYEPFGTQYYWESYYTKSGTQTFGAYSTNQWFGGDKYTTNATNASRIANNTLGWESVKEASLGLDAVLFGKLSVGYTYYQSMRRGVLKDVTNVLPLFYGAMSMYDNYEKYLYTGHEISINFSDRIGDFSYSIGGFALAPKAVNTLLLETTTYDNLKQTGLSTGAVLGYDYIGRFADQADIDNSPKQTFDAEVYPGDLKYSDITGDGTIDTNDRKVIGDTNPKLQYAINLHLAYKGLDLTVVGTGKAFFDAFLNTDWHWNGWGDGNYSTWVRDNIATGAYPRFSYVKSNNNFRNSQFWMVNGGFFKIQNVELGYNFGFKASNKLGIRGIRVFARGANLLTVSGIKDVDPESKNSGITDYPLFKTYTGGLKFTF